MRLNATPPHRPILTRMARTCSWLFALTLLVLCASQEAFAQNARVLQEHQSLEEAVELAKEMRATNPTAVSQELMNRAVEQLKNFEQANRMALQQARRMEAPHGIQDTGGPDAFGYTYIDSDEPGGPVYSFIDITGTGALVASGDDVSSGPVALGGPGFSFYGTTYTALVAATNGYISTDPTDTGPDLSNDCPLPAPPSTGGGGRLYPLHDDLVGDIYYEYYASCPHPHSSGGCNVFHWNNTTIFGGGGELFDFEAILFDNSDIIYQYAPGNPNQGSSSTTGVQDPTYTISLEYACDTGGSITDNLAILITSHPASPDLGLTKTLDDFDEEARTGTYHVTLTNVGTAGATGVEVTDDLPAGVTVTGSSTTQGSFNSATGVWTVGALADGASAELWIDVSFDAQGSYTNSVEVTALSEVDENGDNDYAEVSVDVPPLADLGLTKTLDGFNEEARTGTYHVTLTNDGPDDATGVVVTDDLPPALTITSSSTTQGAFNAGVWTVGTLAAGASAQLWISATFDAEGLYTNTVEVTASSETDPNGANDADETSILILEDHVVPDFVPEAGPGGITDRGRRFEADLVLNKEVDVETADAGDEVTYTITVENLGPHPTTKVEVTDQLPECLDFVSATANRGSYDPGTWIWTIGAVKLNEVLTLDIVASVTADCSGEVTNEAEITKSSLPDPPDPWALFDEGATVANNRDEAAFAVGSGRVLDRTTFALGENYPNPFNPTTVVPFSLAEASFVSIKVYDLLGREVATLVEGKLSAGVHEAVFEASALPTGMYLVRMEAAGIVQTQRVTLMK